MNNKKVLPQKALIPQKTSYIRLFRSSEIIPTRQIRTYNNLYAMLFSASINFYCLTFSSVFLVNRYPSIKIVSAIPAVAAILQAMFFCHTEDPNSRNTCLWSICIVPNSLFKRKYDVLFQEFSFPCHFSKTASTWATSCSLSPSYSDI